MFKNTAQKVIVAIVGMIVLLFTLSVIIATLIYRYITDTGGIILKSNVAPVVTITQGPLDKLEVTITPKVPSPTIN